MINPKLEAAKTELNYKFPLDYSCLKHSITSLSNYTNAARGSAVSITVTKSALGG